MLSEIGQPIDLHAVDRSAMKLAIQHVVDRIRHRPNPNRQTDHCRPPQPSMT